MLDFSDLRSKLEVHIQNDLPTTDIVFENTDINQEYESHVDMEIDDTESFPIDMSGAVYKMTGILRFYILTKQGTGSENARKIASSIVDSLKKFQETVEFVIDGPVLSSVGKVDGTNLYQHNLEVTFNYFYGQAES